MAKTFEPLKFNNSELMAWRLRHVFQYFFETYNKYTYNFLRKAIILLFFY